MVTPTYLAAAAAALAAIAEAWHLVKCRRLGPLICGPGGRPLRWACAVAPMRVAAVALVVWAFAEAYERPPSSQGPGPGKATSGGIPLIVLLDVSPSMGLVDAGPRRDQTRLRRAAELLWERLERLPPDRARVSLVVFYTGARRVGVDVRDRKVLHDFLFDGSFAHVFDAGRTDLPAGLAEAGALAAGLDRPENPGKPYLVVLTDGSSASLAVPERPEHLGPAWFVGVGPDEPSPLDVGGRRIQCRQECWYLKEIARVWGDCYYNGNTRTDLGTTLEPLFMEATDAVEASSSWHSSILAAAAGSALLAVIPLALGWCGPRWDRRFRGVWSHG